MCNTHTTEGRGLAWKLPRPQQVTSSWWLRWRWGRKRSQFLFSWGVFPSGYTSETQTWKGLFNINPIFNNMGLLNSPHPDISSLISPITTVLWGPPGDTTARDPSPLPKKSSPWRLLLEVRVGIDFKLFLYFFFFPGTSPVLCLVFLRFPRLQKIENNLPTYWSQSKDNRRTLGCKNHCVTRV